MEKEKPSTLLDDPGMKVDSDNRELGTDNQSGLPTYEERKREAQDVADMFPGATVAIHTGQGEPIIVYSTLPSEQTQPVTILKQSADKKKVKKKTVKPNKVRQAINLSGLTGFWRGNYYKNGRPLPAKG